MLGRETPLLPDADPLLTLAVVLVAGVLSGNLARRMRLPGITGQILVGILIGPGVLHLVATADITRLGPVTNFALGLMAVTVGAHLNLRRLRNAGKRLFVLLLAEAIITPCLVFGGLKPLGIEPGIAALLGAVAISTAPATTLALVKETRSKGVFVKTLIAAVALNNMACILIFELARAYAHQSWTGGESASVAAGLGGAGLQFVKALLLGGLAAIAMELVNRVAVRSDRKATAALAIILATTGFADWFEISPLLSCLFLGMVQTNRTPERGKLVDQVFSDFEPAIMAVFFTLAGMNLHFEEMALTGLASVLYFFLRAGGKLLAVDIAMRFAKATNSIRKNLGFALLPQAGLAIGLVLIVADDPSMVDRPKALAIFVNVVLTVVTANELIAPILTRQALRRAGEAGKDRTRLIDFIDEQNIVTDLEATDKREVIDRLSELLIHSHHLDHVDKEVFKASVLEREDQASTCLGSGLFVPHGSLPEGLGMAGVMGISRKGLPFKTPDGEPVHCVFLLATPPDERSRHIQVLSTLVRVVAKAPALRRNLFDAKSPAHAYEILHGEEAEDYNYFLDADKD